MAKLDAAAGDRCFASMEKRLWGGRLRTWYLMKEDGVGEPSLQL